ncbi:MAG: RHS repeat-associated core domain-containing protein [Acidobacteria bacterium]|nr:RHS repeat-associated core domain-containing protein [Acidobacteriota bacterium]
MKRIIHSGVVNFLSIALLAILASQTALAQQVPMKAKDTKSTINISEYEKIGLSNGSFSFNIPLAALGGRGVGNGFSYNVETKWRRDEVIAGYTGANPIIQERIDPDPYALRGVFPSLGGYLVANTKAVDTEDIGLCSNETTIRAARKEFRMNFTGFGGSSFSFISTQNDGEDIYFSGHSCSIQYQSIGTVFIATDGSGTKFIADSNILVSDDPAGEGNGPNIYPSGDLKLPNGTTYRVDGGLVSAIIDRNGNRTTLTNTGFQTDIRENRVTKITDALNREIQTSSDANFTYVNYKGFGEADRTVKISNYSSAASTVMLNTLFTWIPANHPYNRSVGCGFSNYIELPDTRRYTFTYNCYGEISRVELPTGGAVEYDHATVSPGTYGSMERRITERRVMSDGTNVDNKTQYLYSSSVPTDAYTGQTLPDQRITTVKLIDNQNVTCSVSKSYFHGCIQDGWNCIVPMSTWGTGYESAQKLLDGMPFKSETYASDGTTLLRKTETTYESRARAVWQNGGNPPYKDYRAATVASTLADSGQVSQAIYGYHQTADFNLLVDTYEYDYGSGQPGAFVRRTHTDFERSATYTQNSVNLLNLPTETWISSVGNGQVKVSRTKYEYDNYNPDQTHAALVDRANITGRAAGYGTGFTARGNATKVTSYADAQNQTGAVSVHTQYDIAGNPVKTIDGKGCESTIWYTDNFGAPNAEAKSPTTPGPLPNLFTYAFATSATNCAGYTTYAQFDYYTGAAVDTEDIIGTVNSTYSNDPLDRPTQVISAANHDDYKARTTVAYNDSQRMVTVTTDSKSFGDNLIKSQAIYDGLGRTIETRDYENSTDYVKALQEYDALGRAYRSSNPFRADLGETAQWTTTQFDDLGRVTEVTTPDNAKVTRRYYGSSVRVWDQANRSRAGVSDALGRLTKVIEYDNGTDLETLFTYDVVGRLRKTIQGSQTRFFLYDDLGRLIRAKQTEQQVNTSLNITDPVTGNSGWAVRFDYDNNGNIVSTTDSRGVTTAGTYDNINRLTFRDYSDSTPDVTFTYDDPNIPNSKSKLTKVSSSVSETRFTAFDDLGRIKSSNQIIDGATYSFPDYSYDLSGALVSQTYPSGRVVRAETDNIGRLSKVTSQMPNQMERTMLSHVAYTSFGAVSSSKLGNGRWETMEYDARRLQMMRISLGGSIGDSSLLKLDFNYGTTTSNSSDNNGSLRKQTITLPGIAPIEQDYTYDALNRIDVATETVDSTVKWRQDFDYDRFGNRTFNAANTTTLPANNAIHNPQVNPADNKFYIADGYLYDSEGNLTSNPEGKTFTYNAENKQTQVYDSVTQTTANYVYDGAGKRVKKTVGNQDTYFVYDAFGKLAAEYTTNQTITTEGTKFLTADLVGSPRVATNNLGQVASRHDYMPFGEEIAATVANRNQVTGYTANDRIRQQFTGYERDGESGLDFAQNRYFAAKHGRFTSVDPLAASASAKNPQTFNRYSYALNSPYKFTDPPGLAATLHCWGEHMPALTTRMSRLRVAKRRWKAKRAEMTFRRHLISQLYAKRGQPAVKRLSKRQNRFNRD